MKIKVEYSESVQVSEGCWRKVGIEMEDILSVPDDGKTADKLHEKAKDYVKKWHIEGNLTTRSYAEPIVNQRELPVIDRSIERLEIFIDDAKTLDDMETLKLLHRDKIFTNDSLTKLYYQKLDSIKSLEELSK